MIVQAYIKETLKYILRSYPIIFRYINEIEGLYTLNEKDLNSRNEKLFIRIFNLAYDKSPFYHKLYSEAGIKKEDIKSIDDLKKLPIITKEIVKENADLMMTVPKWMLLPAYTSGSTGSPLKFYQSWQSIWKEKAYTYCARKRNGYVMGQPLVSLRGNLDRRITHLKVHISNTLYLSSYNINKETIHLYYDLILKHNPIAIQGYPSSLYSLSLYLKDENLKLSIPVCFTSSESLLDFQRTLIQQQLGTEIFDNYGMTEHTIYLQEDRSHKGYYELPGYSINEYVDDGEICTSLINSEFPLIRYKSTDIIETLENIDNERLRVKSIEGRKDDVIYCKDGSFIQQLSFVLKGVDNVKCTQMIQEKNGLLNIRVVPELDFSQKNIEQIENNVHERIGKDNIDFKISIISLADIIYTKRGKFKYLINMLDEFKRQ